MGDEKYIETNHKNGTKQYFYSFVPRDKEGEVDYELLSSAKNKNGNYSRFDIFVFLQFAEASSVDFSTLLRTLFFELSQVFPPEELIRKISNNDYQLYAEGDGYDATSPTGMLEFIGNTSEEFANYSNLLSQMMNTETIKNRPMDEDAKAQIIEFLGEKAENATVGSIKEKIGGGNREQQNYTELSLEDMDEFFKGRSPLVYTMSKMRKDEASKERFKQEVLESIAKENKSFKEVLVPSRDIVCEGIPLEERKKIDSNIKEKMLEGRLIIRWNRKT